MKFQPSTQNILIIVVIILILCLVSVMIWRFSKYNPVGVDSCAEEGDYCPLNASAATCADGSYCPVCNNASAETCADGSYCPTCNNASAETCAPFQEPCVGGGSAGGGSVTLSPEDSQWAARFATAAEAVYGDVPRLNIGADEWNIGSVGTCVGIPDGSGVCDPAVYVCPSGASDEAIALNQMELAIAAHANGGEHPDCPLPEESSEGFIVDGRLFGSSRRNPFL